MNRFQPLPLVVALLLSVSTASAQDDQSGVPLYDNLGDYHYAISTEIPEAQAYFDQGLRLYYAFNHAEAIRAFDEAARLDPTCAICHWGTALSFGPNINMPMDSAAGVAAYQALKMAQDRIEHASAKEQDFIEALATRYVADPPDDRARLDTAYSHAMREVVALYPDDPEARTLYAESIMDLSPWQYWNRDGSPRPDTPELLKQLEHVMAVHPKHPGANHFYIHAVEAVDPERAVSAAERLAGLMPGAGHLVHMPGHIYVRVGRYEEAIMANEHAVHADETYIMDQNPMMGVYVAGYYPHNYDFLAFAASMIGRSEQSVSAAEKMETLSSPEMQRMPGMTFLQNHITRHLQMKVRFGMWDAILETPEPPADLPHARAIWDYAMGRALAAKGDVTGAKGHLERLQATASDPDVADLRLEFNTSGTILEIAGHVLQGHIEVARGDYQAAIAHLRVGAALEDELVYGEPPEWSVPVRQELGYVQLDADQPAAAEETFRKDLDRFPDNGWSLYGLAKALEEEGKTEEAAAVMQKFDKMWATADVDIAGM